MKVSAEPLENCQMLLTIEIDARQEDKLLKTAARRIARQVKIPGYRPGKAPYNLIVRRFGDEAIQQEAIEDLTDRVYKNALKEIDFEPYGPGSLTDVEWNPLVIKVTVPTEPIVDLGNYRDIRLETEEIIITDEEVAESLAALQTQHALYTPVERPAQLGDLVSITLTESDGETILLQEEEDDLYLKKPDEDSEEPDRVTPLLGLSAGDEKTFTVTYPPTYEDEDYAGKEIEITVRVNEVKEQELEPLDDDFAALVGDFDTLDELKENVREGLYRERKAEQDSELADQMLDRVIEGAPTIEWPEFLEEQRLDEALKSQDTELEEIGYSLETYLKLQQKTVEEHRDELRPRIQELLRRNLAISKLAELENLTVDTEEVLGTAETAVRLLGDSSELRDAYLSDAGLTMVANDLLVSKVRQRLSAIARGEAPDPDAVQAEDESAEDTEAEAIPEPATEAEEAVPEAQTSQDI
ncbi:MAG: trigger factor [Anaerolineae bacterium]